MQYNVLSPFGFTQSQLEKSGLLEGTNGKIKLQSGCTQVAGTDSYVCSLEYQPDEAALSRFIQNISTGSYPIDVNNKKYLLWDPTVFAKDGALYENINGTEKDLNAMNQSENKIASADRIAINTESLNNFKEALIKKIKEVNPKYEAPDDAVKSGANGSAGKQQTDPKNKNPFEQVTVWTPAMIAFAAFFTGIGLGLGTALARMIGRRIPIFNRGMVADEVKLGANQAKGQMKAAEDGDIVDISRFTKDMTAKAREDIANEKMGKFSSRAVGPTVEKVVGEIDIALNKAKSANALLVTEAGGGKTETAQEYARRLVERGETDVVVKEIDVGALMAGTQYRGMFERRMQTVLEDAVASAEIAQIIDLASSIPTTPEDTTAVVEARKKIVHMLEIKSKDTGPTGREAQEWLKKFKSSFKKDFEKVVEKSYAKIKNELKNENVRVIYFIDEIHTIIGAGNKEGSLDASNMLKPLLASGKVQFIGATTKSEKHLVMKDGAFYRRFEAIEYGNATMQELALIVKGGEFEVDNIDAQGNKTKKKIKVAMSAQKYLENKHGIKFTNAALDEIVKLSVNGDPNNLEKSNRAVAIDLMDSLASKAKVQIKSLKGAGMTDAQIKAKKYNEIDASFVKQKYREVTIEQPIKKLRAELAVLKAERDWLYRPLEANTWVYPNAAEIQMDAENKPVIVTTHFNLDFIQHEGQQVRFSDLKQKLEHEIAQAKADVQALRGTVKTKGNGFMAADEEKVDPASKPKIRVLLEDLLKIDEQLKKASVAKDDREAINDTAINEDVAKRDLTRLGDLSQRKNESIGDWVKRLEGIKERKSGLLKKYEEAYGLLDQILDKNQELAEKMSPQISSGDDIAEISVGDLMKAEAARLAKELKLAAINIGVAIDIEGIPARESYQKIDDYIKVLKAILESRNVQIANTDKAWEAVYQVEINKLTEGEMNGALPESIRQKAIYNIHFQYANLIDAQKAQHAEQVAQAAAASAVTPKIDFTNLQGNTFDAMKANLTTEHPELVPQLDQFYADFSANPEFKNLSPVQIQKWFGYLVQAYGSEIDTSKPESMAHYVQMAADVHAVKKGNKDKATEASFRSGLEERRRFEELQRQREDKRRAGGGL